MKIQCTARMEITSPRKHEKGILLRPFDYHSHHQNLFSGSRGIPQRKDIKHVEMENTQQNLQYYGCRERFDQKVLKEF